MTKFAYVEANRFFIYTLPLFACACIHLHRHQLHSQLMHSHQILSE